MTVKDPPLAGQAQPELARPEDVTERQGGQGLTTTRDLEQVAGTTDGELSLGVDDRDVLLVRRPRVGDDLRGSAVEDPDAKHVTTEGEP